MGYSENIISLAKTPMYVVELVLDYCSLTFGEGLCTATGAATCYYTYPTCPLRQAGDTTTFVKTSKSYYFSSNSAKPPSGCSPLLNSIGGWKTEIKPQEHITRITTMTIKFLDDAPNILANQDKAVSNVETAGTFWKNLIKRNPNFQNRPVFIYYGFQGDDFSEFNLVFKGNITNIFYDGGEVSVQVSDFLSLLKDKTPRQISSTNTLNEDLDSSETIVDVVDDDEFINPGGKESRTKYVLIGSEIIGYTDVGSNQLSGGLRGRFGTIATTHTTGAKITHVAPFGAPDSSAGEYGDWCLLNLLYSYAGILSTDFALSTISTTITDPTTAGSLDDITLDDVNSLGTRGYLYVYRNNEPLEVIRYSSKDPFTNKISINERGCLETNSVNLAIDDVVYLFEASYEFDLWRTGSVYRYIANKPEEISKMLLSFRQSTGASIWQGSDLKIHCKLASSPVSGLFPNISSITDSNHIISRSGEVNENTSAIITRMIIHYNPSVYSPGEDIDNYQSHLVHFDPDYEEEKYYNKILAQELYTPWILGSTEATALAIAQLLRYKQGSQQISFSLEAKDSHIDVGDFIKVTSWMDVGFDGSASPNEIYEITSKAYDTEGFIYKYIANKVTSSTYRYALISDLPDDYEDYGSPETDTYAWIASGDDSNTPGYVGTTEAPPRDDPPYVISG